MKKLLIAGYLIFVVSNATCKDYTITKENRKQVFQEQDDKKKQENEKQLRESRQELKIEYLRLCWDLLFSEKKCVLRVDRFCLEDWLTADYPSEFLLRIEGKSSGNNEDDEIKVKIHRKYWEGEERPSLGLFCGLYLKYLLARSCLTAEEKQKFKNIILGHTNGTISRDGSTLIISDVIYS